MTFHQKNKKTRFLFCFVSNLHYFCIMRQRVVIALGSNYRAISHVRKARECLSNVVNIDRFSRNMWTEAIDIPSPRFLNCVAIGWTEMTIDELTQTLKSLESILGDSAEERRSGRVHIDLDVLCYGDDLHHLSDWKRDYIITLYNEIIQAR